MAKAEAVQDRVWPSPSIAVFMLLILISALASCGGESGTDPIDPVPTRVEVTPTTATIEALGGTVAFSATVKDQSGDVMAGARVTWSTDDATVATVDADGTATATGNGLVTVTATVGEAVGSAQLEVQQVATEFMLAPDTGRVAKGDTLQLALTALDANGRVLETPVEWSSLDSLVALVEAGVVTAREVGEAGVVASGGGSSDTVIVIVHPVPATVEAAPGGYHGYVGRGTVDPPAVVVRDGNGGPAGGVPVSWQVTLGDGTLSRQGSVTDAMGLATVEWTLGPEPGTQALVASVEGLPEVKFMAEAYKPLTLVTGGGQTALMGEWLPDTIVVKAVLEDGSPAWGEYLRVYIREGEGAVAPSGSSDDLTVRLTTTTAGVPNHPIRFRPGPNIGEQRAVVVWENVDSVDIRFTATGVIIPFKATSLSNGSWHTCAIGVTGDAYCWGYSYYGTTGSRPEPSYPGEPEGPVYWPTIVDSLQFTGLATGFARTCGLTAEGDLYCWGRGDQGQRGDGTWEESQYDPQQVVTPSKWLAVSTGYNHTCGVADDRRGYCWGDNEHGQLGDGTTEDRNLPAEVQGGHSWVKIEAGYTHTCGITIAGAAYCWGKNHNGQLGNGSTEASSVPVPVSGDLEWIDIRLAAGRASSDRTYSCGITVDHLGYCWGSGGLLGTGDVSDVLTPHRVAGENWAEIEPSGTYACGRRIDGSLACWGDTLPVGTGVLWFPSPVLGDGRYTDLDTGTYGACAIEADTGRLVCWGRNFFGALGWLTPGAASDTAAPVILRVDPEADT